MLGLIGKKVGMTQVFNEDGNVIPVTIIKVDTNYVVGERSVAKHGYKAVILGSIGVKEQRVSKPYKGQFKEGLTPLKYLSELREFDKEYKIGDTFAVDLFENIEFVDVKGISKGKGCQGVMKRHGFGGGRKTHGSKFHRTAGSTGMAAWPSRIFKGTRMAGRMGTDRKTVQNLRIVKIDKDQGIILVKGAVPGRRDGTLLITKAGKK